MSGSIVALTGATGFIGKYLLGELALRGYQVRVLLRSPTALPPGCQHAVIGDLARPINMNAALSGVDTVIHSAGIAPSMTGAPAEDFRRLDTGATAALALAAQRAGVRRFIFMSSLRAAADASAVAMLTENSEPKPTDAYGRSKLAAERELAKLDLDWVALRLALVIGPGAKGNLARLIELARSPYPLPFGALRAKRSLLSIANLSAAVECLIVAKEPLRRPLIVADPDALTVPEMVTAMRRGCCASAFGSAVMRNSTGGLPNHWSENRPHCCAWVGFHRRRHPRRSPPLRRTTTHDAKHRFALSHSHSGPHFPALTRASEGASLIPTIDNAAPNCARPGGCVRRCDELNTLSHARWLAWCFLAFRFWRILLRSNQAQQTRGRQSRTEMGKGLLRLKRPP